MINTQRTARFRFLAQKMEFVGVEGVEFTYSESGTIYDQSDHGGESVKRSN